MDLGSHAFLFFFYECERRDGEGGPKGYQAEGTRVHRLAGRLLPRDGALPAPFFPSKKFFLYFALPSAPDFRSPAANHPKNS